MAENSLSFAKKILSGCDLLPRAHPRTADKLDMVLTLHVKNYRKLKNNIIYYTSANICGYWWTNKLVIANGTLFSFMSTNAKVQKPMSCIYKVRGDYTLNRNIEQNGSLLEVEFCHKAILDSKNEYLHCDRLLMEFRYEMEQSKTDNSSFQTLIDRHAHPDFQVLYFPHLRDDLLIKVGDTFLPCHISLLTHCSKYLADCFQKNPPLSNKITFINIDEDANVFWFVISYIYTGELNCLDELVIRQVQKVANILQIDSLEKKCIEYFETNSYPSNEKLN